MLFSRLSLKPLASLWVDLEAKYVDFPRKLQIDQGLEACYGLQRFNLGDIVVIIAKSIGIRLPIPIKIPLSPGTAQRSSH